MLLYPLAEMADGLGVVVHGNAADPGDVRVAGFPRLIAEVGRLRFPCFLSKRFR
jgi:hypothetical protein